MKKRYIAIGIVGVLVVSLVVVSSNKRKAQDELTVKTAVAEMGEVESYLSTTATIKSNDSKDYYGPSAKVSKVNVKMGDSVKIGDVLVEYETQDIQSSVDQAQIQYNNAVLQRDDLYAQNDKINAQIKDLDEEIASLEKSEDPQDAQTLISKSTQRDSMSSMSDASLKQADNSVKLAEISLNSAKKNLSNNVTSIVSENEGVVTSLNVVVGGYGNVAQPVITVQNTLNLKAEIALGKYDAEKIALGQEVILSNGDKEYKGTVSFIEPAASNSTSLVGGVSLGAEIDILEEDANLKINFPVDVDILVGKEESVLKVPAEALKTLKGNQDVVYVLENGIIHEKEVITSIQSDMEVGISEGINEGDKVVLNPSTTVIEGAKAIEEEN
ncbi:MAG: efflux RND transporter periplasmic adaptor subunit [Clostridiaceae bacterium]